MKNAEYNVTWSDDALSDLDSIHEYIAKQEFKPVTAFRVVKNIRETADNLLAFSPYLPLVDIKRLAKMGYRKMVVKNYIVIFKFLEDDNDVSVERVFHGRQNWRRILMRTAP